MHCEVNVNSEVLRHDPPKPSPRLVLRNNISCVFPQKPLQFGGFYAILYPSPPHARDSMKRNGTTHESYTERHRSERIPPRLYDLPRKNSRYLYHWRQDLPRLPRRVLPQGHPPPHRLGHFRSRLHHRHPRGADPAGRVHRVPRLRRDRLGHVYHQRRRG